MSRITRRSIIPVNQITPLTYRDGVTYIQLLTELSEYIKTVLHPSLQHTVDQLVADVEAQMDKHHDQYVEGIQEFQRIHDAFMSDVNASLIALNDGAVSDLVNDDTSLLGKTLRDIFTSHEAFQRLQEANDLQLDSMQREFQGFKESSEQQFDQLKDDTQSRLNAMRDDVEQYQSTVDATFETKDLEHGQLDFVDMLAGMSSVTSIQMRKSSSTGAFEVYLLDPWGYTSQSWATRGDDYYRIWESWRGKTPSSGVIDASSREYQVAPRSNWDFALMVYPKNSPQSSPQWIPSHGEHTAIQRSPLIMRDGRGVIPISSMSTNVMRTVHDYLAIDQRVYGTHPDADGNLLELVTTHKYTSDGRVIVTGRMRAIQDFYTTGGYVLMLPGGEKVSHVLSSFGGRYKNRADGSTQHLRNETDRSTSFAMVSMDEPSFVHAVTFKDPTETLRWSQSDKRNDRMFFIDHTADTKIKLYHQLYERDTLIKAGEVHRFHGEYALVQSPYARAKIDSGDAL